MPRTFQISDRRSLILLLSLVLSAGFFATTLFGYFVSKEAIRSAIIGQDLPLTSSNIYSEIQKDLVRPVLISSTMAHDTFLRDWALRGEKNPEQLARYLSEVKIRNNAFSSFYVSEKTGNYYTGAGVFKQVSKTEPRDAWYYRVRDMTDNYEINVDPDLANRDALTIFINYRVFDFTGEYIGATGIGLTVDSVRRLIREYQERFQRTIYFTDASGRVVLFGGHADHTPDLRARQGLASILDQIIKEKTGSYQFQDGGDNHILNVNYVPELKWYLFVEQNEDVALAGIRKTLYANLVISLAVTLVVIFLTYLALGHYQSKIEEMASTDKLTGLLNRHAFSILIDKLMATYRRNPQPITVLLADIDHFKTVNDRYGHRAGDQVLTSIAHLLRSTLRSADFAVRWGGEEFLMVLPGCTADEGRLIAEKLRTAVEESKPCPDNPAITVTISFGVSQFDGTESTDQTVNRADAALYAAKAAGRNGVCMAAANPAPSETPA